MKNNKKRKNIIKVLTENDMKEMDARKKTFFQWINENNNAENKESSAR